MNNYNQNYQQQGQQPPQGNYQQNNQGGGGQRNNSGFDNVAMFQGIGRIVKDPTSKRTKTGDKSVASTKIAINMRGDNDDADYWFIEVWDTNKRVYNYLLQHCQQGRRVFISGTPTLGYKKKGDEHTYWPTIKLTDIIGLDMPTGSDGQGGNQ
jgi:hypothetical protein